jgi:hypothetical protein
MTEKDYRSLALMIFGRLPVYESERKRLGGKYDPIRDLVHDMANLFASENPKFDRARFIDVCVREPTPEGKTKSPRFTLESAAALLGESETLAVIDRARKGQRPNV